MFWGSETRGEIEGLITLTPATIIVDVLRHVALRVINLIQTLWTSIFRMLPPAVLFKDYQIRPQARSVE